MTFEQAVVAVWFAICVSLLAVAWLRELHERKHEAGSSYRRGDKIIVGGKVFYITKVRTQTATFN